MKTKTATHAPGPCKCGHPSANHSDAERRLWVAAPNLLAALKASEELLAAFVSAGDGAKWHGALSSARAAIAKAEGK